MTSELADLVASSVLEKFNQLPAKRRPSVRSNALHEWVPLSGIVARASDGSYTCLALATGMKCLPSSKLPDAKGVAIHDWHAEVLAIRAFNLFVLQECRRLASGELSSSDFLRPRAEHETNDSEAVLPGNAARPFAWRDDVSLHMYCSEAPCGDASMELIMAAQEDASPWDVPEAAAGTDPSVPVAEDALPGRAYFSHLGIVRRKPARGDAPLCLSKSCSDKIALKQCTSLLSSIVSLFVSPERVYISTMVLPHSQYSAVACSRCFSAEGRMRPLVGRRWEGGYSFVPFTIEATQIEFPFSKRAVAERAEKIAASNMAVAWIRDGPVQGESLVGGVLQGAKQFGAKGASLTSRRKLWGLGRETAELLGDGLGDIARNGLLHDSYQEVKESPVLERRNLVKDTVRQEALRGWARNVGDASFGLD